MKIKNKLFFKIFGLMTIGFLIVFLIQFLGRFFFFNTVYINEVNNSNIKTIENLRDKYKDGEDISEYIYFNSLSDLTFYITNDTFEPFPEDEFILPTDNIDVYFASDINYKMSNDIYYYTFESEEGFGANYSVYYTEIDDGVFLVAEHYFNGLNYANDVQTTIDFYVIVGLILFLIPYTYWYTKRFTSPLIKMNKQVAALSNLEFLPPLKISSSDEIGELSQSINRVSKDLEKAISKLQNDIEFEQLKDKKRRELIATLSHELKTPITTMRGVIEGMSDNVGKYQDRDIYLKESLGYLHYMESLSNNLIEAISIESKTLIKNRESISNIIETALKYTEKEIQDKRQRLIIQIQDIEVNCNFDMILRVIINLLSNASKYSNKDECITVSNKEYKDYTEISILNTGVQLQDTEFTKVYDPFYRIEKSRSKETGGSGLGLYIIKTVLDKHESTYGMKNTPEGVLFTFTLQKST